MGKKFFQMIENRMSLKTNNMESQNCLGWKGPLKRSSSPTAHMS